MLCNLCGKPLSDKKMYCPECTAKLGKPLRSEKVEAPPDTTQSSDKKVEPGADPAQSGSDGDATASQGTPLELDPAASGSQRQGLPTRVAFLFVAVLLVAVFLLLRYIVFTVDPPATDRELILSRSSVPVQQPSQFVLPTAVVPKVTHDTDVTDLSEGRLPNQPSSTVSSPTSAESHTMLMPESLSFPTAPSSSAQQAVGPDFSQVLPSQPTLAAFLESEAVRQEVSPTALPEATATPTIQSENVVRFFGARRTFIGHKAYFDSARRQLTVYLSQNDLAFTPDEPFLNHTVTRLSGLPRGVDLALVFTYLTPAASECSPTSTTTVKAYIYRTGIAGFPIPGTARVLEVMGDPPIAERNRLTCRFTSGRAVELSGILRGKGVFRQGQAEYPLIWDLLLQADS